jgi:hypothetical protein
VRRVNLKAGRATTARMYSSLHKIDIVADIDGPMCVQTDHRDRAELEAQREISIVFGVTRMVAPGLADPTKKRVQYVCMGELPPFMRELVRVCGATYTENGEKDSKEPAVAADLEAVAKISHEALMTLGRAVLEKRGLEATPEGLRQLEDSIREEDVLDLEENEIEYYETMVELAAAGGVVIAGLKKDSRWCVTPQVMSLVPLALDLGGGQLTNVFGRTERFFEGEVERGPSALCEMTEQRPDAPVVGILKPVEWGNGHKIAPLTEPLVKGEGVPLIAYAHDHPNAVAYINTTSGMTLDEARAKAQDFYKTIEVNVERMSADLPIWLVTGGYYAPEKMLDRAFGRELHTRLEAETLLVALPARGVAAIVPVRTGSDPLEASVIISSFANRAQERCPPAERVTKIPFIMMDGQICGYVKLDGDEGTPEPPPKKGFWKRLFGG